MSTSAPAASSSLMAGTIAGLGGTEQWRNTDIDGGVGLAILRDHAKRRAQLQPGIRVGAFREQQLDDVQRGGGIHRRQFDAGAGGQRVHVTAM